MTAAATPPQDEPIPLLMDEFYDATPAKAPATIPALAEPATVTPVENPDHEKALKMYTLYHGNLDRFTEQERVFVRTHLPEKERLIISDRWRKREKTQRQAETPTPAPIPKVTAEVPQNATVTVPIVVPQYIQDYEVKHPDFFPPGTTLEQKIKHFEKIQAVQKKVDDQKNETFKKLDAAVEAKATSTELAKKESEIAETAREIYESGDFLKYCTDTFQKVWLGDAHILMGILLMAANMRVINAQDGIHLHIMGGTQTGKSDSVKAAMQFVHPADRLIKTFSMKYLFYADDELHQNSIVFSDDTTFDPETAALYRNMLTSWFTGVTRGTVVNHAKKDLHIPPRVSLILTSVESVVQETDDGQDESRFLTLEVRRTADQMKAIREFIQQDHPDIKSDLEVIYAIWTAITPKAVKLHKSIDRDIPIREFKRLLSLVQAHALLCNRSETIGADFKAIDQFLTYSKPMIDASTPAFTRKETAVLQCLADGKKRAVGDIVTETGMTIQDVYRALHGRNGTFQNPKGGLMGKEPKLEYLRESPPGVNDIHTFWLRK